MQLRAVRWLLVLVDSERRRTDTIGKAHTTQGGIPGVKLNWGRSEEVLAACVYLASLTLFFADGSCFAVIAFCFCLSSCLNGG